MGAITNATSPFSRFKLSQPSRIGDNRSMKRFAFTLFAITATWALCQTPTVAQDAPAEQAPFTWKTSGDTLEDFKVELVPAKPLDQSSAEACVKSFLALADGRESAIDSLGALERTLDKVVAFEQQDDLKQTFTNELVSNPELKVAESEAPRTLGDSWGIEKLDRLQLYWGGTWSTTRENSQRSPVREDDVGIVALRPLKNNEVPMMYMIEVGFHCRKDEKGNWRILRIMRRYDWDDTATASSPYEPRPRPDLTLTRWQPIANPYLKLQSLPKSVPDPANKFDTTENLIDAYLSGVIQHRYHLREVLGRRVLQAWIDAILPLLHPDWISELQAAEVPQDNEVPDPTSFEIIEERDNPLSVVVQMNDPQRRSWLVFVRKKGDGYQITKLQRRFTAIRVRDGVEVEFLEDAKSIWDVAKEPVLTSYQLPIFLVG